MAKKFNKGDSVKVTLSGEVRGTVTNGSLTVTDLGHKDDFAKGLLNED